MRTPGRNLRERLGPVVLQVIGAKAVQEPAVSGCNPYPPEGEFTSTIRLLPVPSQFIYPGGWRKPPTPLPFSGGFSMSLRLGLLRKRGLR
jgi:hypothetical protein